MKGKIIDLNYAKVESYIEKKRPPKEIRDQVDLGFKMEKNTYELFEVRPTFGSSNPNEYEKNSFAKFRFVKTQKVWKLYWMRASGKWESYGPFPESCNLDEILSCIENDEFGCFYG